MFCRLISIGPSHYCEKARWALDRAGFAYVEERHFPAIHWAATLRNRYGRSVPLLVTESRVYANSTDILRFVDRVSDWQLYPGTVAARHEVETLETRFDQVLGPDTFRFAYYHLLDRRHLLHEGFAVGAPRVEGILFRALYPAIAELTKRFMRINPESYAGSVTRIRATFAEISKRVERQRYLVGQEFTAADLTFASLAAPVLLPDKYGAWLPERSVLPPSAQTFVDELRATPAGQFALRLYREERGPLLRVSPHKATA